MSKTPVSILQEMMMKTNIIPNYNLIHDGGGSHVNTFTYQVTCGDVVASGSGRSKKDAKHETAVAMLRAIAEKRNYPQLPETPVQSPVRTPLPPKVPETPRIPPSVPFCNSVGKLQELCADNNLQSPDYIQISDVGPPHARVFTIQCKVATFKESGIARTKKQAKQDAAKKMLDKLSDLVSDVNNIPDSLQQLKIDKGMESIKQAKTYYPTISKLSAVKKANFGVKVSSFHKEFKNSLSIEACEELIKDLESLLPQHTHENISTATMSDLHSKLEEILSSHSLCLSDTKLKTKNPNIHAVCMRIDVSPVINIIGLGDTPLIAEVDAAIKLIKTLLLLLK